MDAEIGQRLGDYEILSLLGAGGMGRVYRVRHVISNRIEAMKVLQPDLASLPELAARFTAEIRTLASFDHPNIAQLRTAFQHENQLIMIMEFVEGVTLDNKAGKAAMPVAEVLDYTEQVLAALSYAHGRGVVHRDLKPANIMVTGQGVVKLMDFGIAKSQDEMMHTKPGTTMGSVYYMSPEQVSGGTVDARSDIYSLGVTLYELLTGQRPFQASTTFSILNAQLNTVPKPPIELNAGLPAALNEIILTAMQKDPAMRFQSADAFLKAVRSLKIDLPAAVPKAPVQDVPANPFAPTMEQRTTPVAAPASMPAPQTSANEPPFMPVPGVVTPLSQTRSNHRSLWIGLGAVAALIAMISAATVLPRFFSTHATSSGEAVQTSPAQVPATPAPGQVAAPSAQTQPPDQTQVPSQTQSANEQPGNAESNSAPPTVTPPNVEPPRRPANRAAATHGAAAGSQKSEMAVPSPSGATATAPTGPSQAELKEASEQLMQISSRASAVRDSIDQIRRQQEADGLGMRGDIVASLSRMNSYLDAANRALGVNDVVDAKQDMEKAERELAKLEGFLGKQ
jgi:eukaryotic-like serine/threonine-protein kinase